MTGLLKLSCAANVKRRENPMLDRLTRRAEWDGTFSLLLDGNVILERKPLADVEFYQHFLEADMLLCPRKYCVDKPTP
jgi:hypothetical protein